MDVEHDNDRTASLILQEIDNSEAGGEYNVSSSSRDVQFSKNIQEQVKHATPIVTKVEMIEDHETKIIPEEGVSATETLKKAIEGRIYQPQIPPGHRLNLRQDERVKYNKTRLKEMEEDLTLDPNQFQMYRGADTTHLQNRETETPNLYDSRDENSENLYSVPPPNPEQIAGEGEDPPYLVRRSARGSKPTRRLLEYIIGQSEDPDPDRPT